MTRYRPIGANGRSGAGGDDPGRAGFRCADSHPRMPVARDTTGDPSTFEQVWQWLQGHSELLTWLFVGSLASLALALALLPVLVVRMPVDYFAAERAPVRARRSAGGWIAAVLKNLLGALFVLAGLAMLVLPGQGLLTILIGLMLLDFPAKRRIERRIVARPAILAMLNRMRARRGRDPLRVD